MPKKAPELPGMERKTIKAIESAAEEYAELRDKRMAVLEKEVEAKARLLDVMHKHECTIYKFDDKIVEVLPTEKVKVRKAGSKADEDDGEDEE